MFKEFKKFILKGNLVDLAIGFTVGASFSTVAKSLVDDIIMPPISLLLGKSDFSNSYLLLRPGDNPPYDSLVDATKDNAITLNYGEFINNVLALLVVALAMFLIIKIINHLDEEFDGLTKKEKKEKENEPTNKKCKFCLTLVPYRARRCPACTSDLPKKKV